MKKQFGLIGYPLSHSFSKKYFAEKFQAEGITDCNYELYEIDNIAKVKNVFAVENLRGINVTIPYKHDIMQFIDEFDHSVRKIGAMNVVKIDKEGKKIGYNSDYYGFRLSLEKWLEGTNISRALILGIGGAAKAVIAVLKDLNIKYLRVSRDEKKGDLSYTDLLQSPEIVVTHQLIINTTPLGMSPAIERKPDLPYDMLSDANYLYDLIYNPAETNFMKEGIRNGAQVKNGLEMLELQAEKSWEIWNS